MYGNSAAFFVVSTAFLQKRDRESYPRAAENRLQRRAGRACAGLRRGAGQASGRRQKGAGWARSSLCAVQRGRGRLRPSAARSAEAPDRRAPSPTPCKQTPSMKGAGNADIGEAVNFFILRCTFIKKIAREFGRKTDQDASSSHHPPLSSISIMGVANTGRGPSVNSAWPEFSGGATP